MPGDQFWLIPLEALGVCEGKLSGTAIQLDKTVLVTATAQGVPGLFASFLTLRLLLVCILFLV